MIGSPAELKMIGLLLARAGATMVTLADALERSDFYACREQAIDLTRILVTFTEVVGTPPEIVASAVRTLAEEFIVPPPDVPERPS